MNETPQQSPSLAELIAVRKTLKTSQIILRMAGMRGNLLLVPLAASAGCVALERAVSAYLYNAPNEISVRDAFALGAAFVCSTAVNLTIAHRALKSLRKASAALDEKPRDTVDTFIRRGLRRSSRVLSVTDSFAMTTLVACCSLAQKAFSGGFHLEGAHPDARASAAVFVFMAVLAWRCGVRCGASVKEGQQTAANWISYEANAFDGDPRAALYMRREMEQAKKRRQGEAPLPK